MLATTDTLLRVIIHCKKGFFAFGREASGEEIPHIPKQLPTHVNAAKIPRNRQLVLGLLLFVLPPLVDDIDTCSLSRLMRLQ
jgi:hypothetical protein